MKLATLLFIIATLVPFDVLAQEESRIFLLHSDRLYHDSQIDTKAQILVGNVQFRHEDIFMYCDSALFYESSNSLNAFGNVRMNQGDTLNLTGDILYYDGTEKLARVRNNVVLIHGDMTLYTDSLDYDRLYNVGYFFEGGHLITKDNDLTSDWGEYRPETKDAVFNFNVQMLSPAPPQKPQTTLLTDTLYYNTVTSVANTRGPSTIDDGGCHIYTISGYMDSKSNNLTLLQRSEMSNNGKKLVADSIIWNSTDSIGEAFGNLIYTDAINQNAITGHYCYYNEKTGYSVGTDSICIMDFSQGPDTMYMHADSIKLFTHNIRTDSAHRTMHAYNHVRMYRKDMQGVCDSLVYLTKDSVMIMYKDPIVWTGGQQLLGEEIMAFTNDSTIDSIHVVRQALSCEHLDSIHYNQISGHEIRSYMKDGELEMTHVIGNAIANYFPFDEDSIMVAMNHIESTEMKMFMGENRKVKKIWMPAATGTFYPIPMIPNDVRFLENFQWFDYIRPISPEDIFLWRGKTKGTELKKTTQRKVPLQKLNKIEASHGNVQNAGAAKISSR
ncbi:MAG: LPS export ABC transporter periplasmic protein LptC [Bacteroidaceae bacterium]|nr:LPS export ABC transporter periplasmic protein LptC [Bacteroidaceae bacterium]